MLKLKIFVLIILLALTQTTIAAAIFTIKPSTITSVIRSDSSTMIPYTVTNTSGTILSGITIHPQFGTDAHVAAYNNTCKDLSPNATCSFNLMIPGDQQPSPSFTISPKICVFNETICSQPPSIFRLHVFIRNVDHPARAYIGLTNNFVYRITLVPGSPGNLGEGLPSFNLNEPAGIALNGLGTVAYIINDGTKQVYMIDTATNQHHYTYNIGTTATAILVSPDESKLYVANYHEGLSNGKVSVLGADKGPLLWNIEVGNGPWGLAISPDSIHLYVSNSADNTVSIANAVKAAVDFTVNVGVAPLGIAATPDGSKIYVANSGCHSVSVIDTNDYQVIATIPVGGTPKSLAINPTSTQVYVANWLDGTVSSIDAKTNQVIATTYVGAGPIGLAVSPDGTQLYVTLDQTNAVAVVNISDLSVQYVSTPAPQISMGNFIG